MNLSDLISIKRQYPAFDAEGSDYDYETAIAAGMGANGTGENQGHWGSVAPSGDGNYQMLKGANHPTWGKGVFGETIRGSTIRKIGDRYYSIPNESEPMFRPMTDLLDPRTD